MRNLLPLPSRDTTMNPTKSTCDDSRLQPDDVFRLQPCEDGSLTVHSVLHDQCFHSSAGAILESRYIYLELGLKAYLSARQNAALQNAARNEQADANRGEAGEKDLAEGTPGQNAAHKETGNGGGSE